MAKGMYIGVAKKSISLTNLLPKPSEWTKEGSIKPSVSANEEFVFPVASGDSHFYIFNMTPPTANHKYYIRCMMRAPIGTSFSDARFEYWRDDTNLIRVHAAHYVTGNWEMASTIGFFTDVSGTWQFRNFVVNSSQITYRKEPMLIDLTACFGAGNEPTKEWCDANIPYFLGTSYIEVDTSSSMARKIKQLYIGISNQARKVKKGYIGINGIAVQFFSAGIFAYKGIVGALQQYRASTAVASAGDVYFVCAGGEYQGSEWSYASNTVQAINDKFTVTLPTVLQSSQYSMGAGSVGNFAVFGGGKDYDDVHTSMTHAYSSDLTYTIPTRLTNVAVQPGTANLGEYLIFACGDFTTGREYTQNYKVDAYNTSLVKTQLPDAGQAHKHATVTAGNKYTIVAGGIRYQYYNNWAYAYDLSFTRTTAASLSTAKAYLAHASIGDYALIAGGVNGNSTYYDTVECYNSNLTKTIITPLSSVSYYYTKGVGTENGAYFFGSNISGYPFRIINKYDEDLVRTVYTDMSVVPNTYSIGTFQDYIVLCGATYIDKNIYVYDI